MNRYPDITVSYKLNTAASATMPTGLTALTASANVNNNQVATFSTLTNFLDPVANPNGAWIKLTNKNSHFNFVVSDVADSDFGKMLFTYASTVYYCSADATTATAFTSSTQAVTVGYNVSATPTTQVVRDIYLHFTQAKLRQLTSACLKVQCSPRLQTVTIGGCIVQDTEGKYKNNTAVTGHLQVAYPSASSDTAYSTATSKSGAYGYTATLNKNADHESGLTWKGWTTATVSASGDTTAPSITNSATSYTIEPTGNVTYYGVWQRNTYKLDTVIASITPILNRRITVKVYERTPNGGFAGTYTMRENSTTYLTAAVATSFSSFAAQTLSPAGKASTYKYVGYTTGTTAAPTDATVNFTTGAITLASGSVTTAPSVTGANQNGLYYGATAYSKATYTNPNATDITGFTTGASVSTVWSYSWSLDNAISTIGATSSSNCSVVMRSNSTATLTPTVTENITGEEVHIIIQSIENLSATLTATNVFAYQ